MASPGPTRQRRRAGHTLAGTEPAHAEVKNEKDTSPSAPGGPMGGAARTEKRILFSLFPACLAVITGDMLLIDGGTCAHGSVQKARKYQLIGDGVPIFCQFLVPFALPPSAILQEGNPPSEPLQRRGGTVSTNDALQSRTSHLSACET